MYRRSDGIQVLRFCAAAMVVALHSTFYVHERFDHNLALWAPGARGVDIFLQSVVS
jgi:peptidoglycan/LPS O-acetylase OafA/YrhL